MWLARNGNRHALLVRTVAFSLAVLVAACSFGAVLGLAGVLAVSDAHETSALMVILLSVGLWALLRELRFRRLWIPSADWQVPEWWGFAFYRGAMAFGIVMGIGAFTRQPSALYHVYVLGCIFSGSWAYGLIFGAIYGMIYVAVFYCAMFFWRDGAAGSQRDQALGLLRVTRPIGALAAPALALAPF